MTQKDICEGIPVSIGSWKAASKILSIPTKDCFCGENGIGAHTTELEQTLKTLIGTTYIGTSSSTWDFSAQGPSTDLENSSIPDIISCKQVLG